PSSSSRAPSVGGVVLLLMIISIKPANGPSNRGDGHTVATLSPPLFPRLLSKITRNHDYVLMANTREHLVSRAVAGLVGGGPRCRSPSRSITQLGGSS